MALDQASKDYAHTMANDFVIQGLIAILIKLHPNDDVAGALGEYVQKQIDEAVTSGGVSTGQQEEFKAHVRQKAEQLMFRGVNASR